MSKFTKPLSGALRVGLLSLICALSGCVTSITYGTPPRIDQLAILQLGVSTSEEVRQKLGEPRGYGAVRIEPTVPMRTIWFYEYEHSAGSRMNIHFLLVYFYQDHYEGHNWFSSGSLLQQK